MTWQRLWCTLLLGAGPCEGGTYGSIFDPEPTVLCTNGQGSHWCTLASATCGGTTQVAEYPNISSCEAAAKEANEGGASGGGGESSFECDTYNDQTAYFGDVQLDTLCQGAGYYATCGPEEGVAQTCANLNELLDCCWDGGGSCPHC